jgi:hypothetical protein
MAELAGIGDGSPSVVELPPVTAEDELRLICHLVEQLSADLNLLPADSRRRPAVAAALGLLAQELESRRPTEPIREGE